MFLKKAEKIVGCRGYYKKLVESKVQWRRQSGVDGKAALAAWGMLFSGTGVVGNLAPRQAIG